MMMKHETNIDTVAIQLDFNTGIEQRNKFYLICNWITSRGLGKIELNKVKLNRRISIYDLLSGKSKIATIQTGFSKNFYIRIRWCGLKSFKQKQDEKSFSSLMTICALLNTTRSRYRFVELDIALDLFCPFNKTLAVCINPVNNVPYNQVNFYQYFKGIPISYIEDYRDINKRKYAMKRSYLYDKSNKEDLDYFLTRFEIKLQNRFFLRNGFNLSSITKALNKYAVFYFNNLKDKQFELSKLVTKKSINNIELFMLEQNSQRIHYNLLVIEEFIKKVETVYVNYWGDVTLPQNFDTQNKIFF